MGAGHADLHEAALLDGVHDLRAGHLTAVQRQEGELRLHHFASEDLEVRAGSGADVVDLLNQLGVRQSVDRLEAADDGCTAAQGPHLAAHFRRKVAGERGTEFHDLLEFSHLAKSFQCLG